jgi:hypothetical protein
LLLDIAGEGEGTDDKNSDLGEKMPGTARKSLKMMKTARFSRILTA